MNAPAPAGEEVRHREDQADHRLLILRVGGGGGGGAGGSGQPPVIVPGPSLKNKSSDRLTEVFGTVAAYARVDLQDADNPAGAEIFIDDAVAFDFAEHGPGDDGPGENRLMCLHGVSSAPCGDHD